MPAHDEHGTRVFSGGPPKGPAHKLWSAQCELEAVRARTAVPAAENTRDTRAARLAGLVSDAQKTLGGRVFRIPTQSLAELRRRIEQLDRRAGKLGTGT